MCIQQCRLRYNYAQTSDTLLSLGFRWRLLHQDFFPLKRIPMKILSFPVRCHNHIWVWYWVRAVHLTDVQLKSPRICSCWKLGRINITEEGAWWDSGQRSQLWKWRPSIIFIPTCSLGAPNLYVTWTASVTFFIEQWIKEFLLRKVLRELRKDSGLISTWHMAWFFYVHHSAEVTCFHSRTSQMH